MSDTSVTGGSGQPRPGQPRPDEAPGAQQHADQASAGQATVLAWTAGTALAALALFACYLRQSATIAVGSDGASQALQAWDLLHGNPLLHGWWMTDVSFYTTELPQYALIEAAHGLNPDVIHLAGAMTYTLLVLTAALLAAGRATGMEALVRAAVTAGVLLAPSLGPGTQTLVLSPDHTGTAVPVLLIFLLIDRLSPNAEHRRIRGLGCEALLVGLALAWTAVADAMTIFVAILPLALVCTARVLSSLTKRRHAVAPSPDAGTPSTTRRREAVLAAAAVLAIPAALAATALLNAVGGYQVNGLRAALATTAQLAGNARLTAEGLLELFGANVFGAANGPQGALAAVHLAGAALAVAATATAARRFFRAPLIESVLLAGIVIDLAAYLPGVQAVDILSTREIAPVLPFAAVLAGRLLGPKLLPAPQAPSTPQARATVAALCATLALYLAGLGYAAAQPPALAQDATLAAWLRAHHLTAGLSGYHQANIVTLDSGGAVTLRPVRAVAGRLAAYAWNADSAWFDPAAATATFLVLTAPGAPGSAGLTTGAAIATFGRPVRAYRDGGFVILVWSRVNLVAALR